jgi:hypothetical protein
MRLKAAADSAVSAALSDTPTDVLKMMASGI